VAGRLFMMNCHEKLRSILLEMVTGAFKSAREQQYSCLDIRITDQELRKLYQNCSIDCFFD
jgi:hypothetical protein